MTLGNLGGAAGQNAISPYLILLPALHGVRNSYSPIPSEKLSAGTRATRRTLQGPSRKVLNRRFPSRTSPSHSCSHRQTLRCLKKEIYLSLLAGAPSWSILPLSLPRLFADLAGEILFTTSCASRCCRNIITLLPRESAPLILGCGSSIGKVFLAARIVRLGPPRAEPVKHCKWC